MHFQFFPQVFRDLYLWTNNLQNLKVCGPTIRNVCQGLNEIPSLIQESLHSPWLTLTFILTALTMLSMSVIIIVPSIIKISPFPGWPTNRKHCYPSHKRRSKIERWWTYRRPIINGSLQDTASGTINTMTMIWWWNCLFYVTCARN